MNKMPPMPPQPPFKKAEPVPVKYPRPTCPKLLGKTGLATWKRLIPLLNNPTDGDLQLLEQLCIQTSVNQQAAEDIQTHGTRATNAAGSSIANPSCNLFNSTSKQILHLNKALGLNAMTKHVSRMPQPDEDDGFDQI
ncbi:phage terminase small subunit P27 family [Aeromonas salmonicida]|uniref:phage terminase small subunit P27 family n=1 Tax=Aeromonas salmonicida TaxID=645 RepID=UPI003F7C775A